MNAKYWECTVLCCDRLPVCYKEVQKYCIIAELLLLSSEYAERRSGINTSVTENVVSIFKGKTLSQLATLHTQIQKKLAGGEGIDVGKYWALYDNFVFSLYGSGHEGVPGLLPGFAISW